MQRYRGSTHGQESHFRTLVADDSSSKKVGMAVFAAPRDSVSSVKVGSKILFGQRPS